MKPRIHFSQFWPKSAGLRCIVSKWKKFVKNHHRTDNPTDILFASQFKALVPLTLAYIGKCKYENMEKRQKKFSKTGHFTVVNTGCVEQSACWLIHWSLTLMPPILPLVYQCDIELKELHCVCVHAASDDTHGGTETILEAARYQHVFLKNVLCDRLAYFWVDNESRLTIYTDERKEEHLATEILFTNLWRLGVSLTLDVAFLGVWFICTFWPFISVTFVFL